MDSALTAGKLIDMKWKLGVAVSSDECKSLNSPCVTMTLKVADSSGKISTHSMEMTISQFQNFSKQMKEMANKMEMV
ncbi:COMM domain-containing protein 6-like [Saccostrea echinata]|uniref:COMM domain-containing protein 6-like n=1 Tax=Saccostrea echinata TaxID=191078 RepID=UPI002A833DD8|nr:COMM domain-containing protein 6-like [Saccostrea echinata]XP_061164112.1 COMM domain-containing protein 6-like [Saccostrea echinata]